jgi:hypothetical protein
VALREHRTGNGAQIRGASVVGGSSRGESFLRSAIFVSAVRLTRPVPWGAGRRHSSQPYSLKDISYISDTGHVLGLEPERAGRLDVGQVAVDEENPVWGYWQQLGHSLEGGVWLPSGLQIDPWPPAGTVARRRVGPGWVPWMTKGTLSASTSEETG